MITTPQVSGSLTDIARRDNKEEQLTKTEATEKRINDQKKSFLKLLTIQLQNQDPTNPMDTNQMAAQIFTMTSLEQQLESNRILEKIHDLLLNQQIAQPSSNIGKAAYYEGNTFKLTDGKAEFDYIIDNKVDSAKLEIKNGLGQTVYEAPLNISFGTNTFEWNGEDRNGKKLADGNYNISITAIDFEKNPVTVKTFMHGKIDGIISEKNDFKFSIDGKEIDKDKIKAIKESSASSISSEHYPKTVEAKIKDEVTESTAAVM